VSLDSTTTLDHLSRLIHGTAATADLAFDARGNLHTAHLEQNVDFNANEQRNGEETHRNWKSPHADLLFRTLSGKTVLANLHGNGGVSVTSLTRNGNSAPMPAKITADDLSSDLDAGQSISTLLGVGHASMEETSANRAQQITHGDRLEVHFASSPGNGKKPSGDLSQQIKTALVDGHVVLIQKPAPGAAADELHATAGKATYDGAADLFHLTVSPRVENGSLQLTADRIDASRSTGEAWAHGNVKASWKNDDASARSASLGGQGMTHAVSSEAQLQQTSGEVTFKGKARLWQDANSVAAPVIVLNHSQQTLTAHAIAASDPVRTVFLAARASNPAETDKNHAPAVIRIKGGELRYSALDRKVLVQAGVLQNVTAETETATSVSRELEILLLPAGKSSLPATGQVDRIYARGHVQLSTAGRRGIGEQLLYTCQNEEYLLTGAQGTPPRITDSVHGNISGEAVIYHARDGSVTVEGGKGKTSTETRTPR
jgi:lipopolysaccharide export system protein LptA